MSGRIRYYANDSITEPEAVQCDEVGYPHRDAQGRIQYDNTHYDTEAEAWERLVEGAEAWVSLAGDGIRTAREALRRAEENAGKAAEHFTLVQDGVRRFRREAERSQKSD